MAGDRIDQLYNALKADGSSVPSRDIFRKNMLASGKTGYKNRLDFFNAMKADGADVGNTYEDFAKRLGLHAVKKGARNAGTPMSEADKTRFIVGANNIAYQGQQTVKNAGRYNNLKQRKQKQQRDFGRVNIGAHQTPYGGDANNVLKDEGTGQYFTSDSETTNNLTEAQGKQAALDEQNNAYQNAVDTGEIPSVFDVRDKNGNYDLQENIGKDGTYLTEEGAQNQLERKLQDAYARKKEIEDAIAEDNQKNGNPLLSYSASLGGGNGRDAESSDYRNKLATSLSLITQQIGALEAVKQYPTSSWGEDAWKALDNTAFTAKTWDFGLSDFATMGQMERIKTKMDNNIPLSGSDKMLLNSKLGADAAAALEDEKMGSIYRWTKIAGQSLPFMADFFLTGGYGGITKGLSRGALKIAAKRGMGKVSAAILKNTGIVMGDVIGSYAMAGTEQALKTGADIMQRHMGSLYQDENGNYAFGTFDENGNLLHEGGETIGKALYKGLTSAMVENYTEKLFGHNYGIKKGALNFMEKHGMGRAADFFKNIGQSGWYRGSKKWMEKFGINGFGEEVMEEEFGIPLHALLDGDNKMSDLLDPKQQLDIIGGMAISVGSMYAMGMGPRLIHNRAQYYRFKHKVDVADSNAQQLLGDNWESWKEQMDNATNDKMGGVLYNILRQRDNMGKEQINAAIQYGVNLMKMRGYNLTKTAEMNAKELTGEQDTEEDKHDNDIDNAYSEGHEAEGEDTHEIQIEQADKQRSLASLLGISEQQLSSMSNDELDAMAGQNDNLDRAIYEYQLSNAKYQGVMDNANDQVDMAAQRAATMTDMITDQSRGTVRNATIKATKGAEDYGVYIISGNLATHDDGTINVSDSDKMIIYYDPQTGTVEHADASRFAALGDENPAEDVKAQAIADAKEKAIREVAGIIDGKVEVGTQFDVTDADGTQHTYEVLADNGDGTAMITLDGNVEQNPYSFEDLQNLKDAEDEKTMAAARQQRAELESQREQQKAEQKKQEEEKQAQQNQAIADIIDDNGNVVIAAVEGNEDADSFIVGEYNNKKTGVKKYKVVTLNADGTVSKPSLVDSSKVSVIDTMSADEYKQTLNVSETSPVVDNGGENVDNNEVPLQPSEETTTVDGNTENTTEPERKDETEKKEASVINLEDGTVVPMLEDGNPDFSQLSAAQTAELYDEQFGDDADGVISGRVNDAKKELDKANNMTIKGKNFVEQKASKAAKEKAIADAQAAYDSAKAISDAYNERQLTKEEGTPEGRKDLIEKAKAKFARLKNKDEWKNQTQALYNETIGKVLHRLYDGLGVNVFDHEPQTVEEYVSSSIAPYSLNYEGTETSKGVKQETGLQRKDFAKSHVLAAEGKGVTVDDFVHKLWDNRPSQLENVSDQEIRNTLLDLITSDMNAYDMQHVIENNRIAQAEKEIEDEKTAAENAQMSNQSNESAPNDSENGADNANDGAESSAADSEAEVAPSEKENFPSKLKEPIQEESTEVPEDSTPEKPLGEQKDSAPFSAKDEGEQETPEERAANVEKNKVDGTDVVDAIIGKKMRKSLARIAKMMGAKIQYQYTDKLGNGWYDADTNTIYLTLDSSITEGVQFIFGHEMTHEIKTKNAEAYNELAQLVKNSITDFDKAVDAMEKRYSEAGLSGYDRSYYEEEVVADGIGHMLQDLNYAHTLALKMSHPLLAKIHEIINRIRMAFHGTEYTETAKQIMRSIEQAYVKTANGTFEDSTTGEDARYSLRQKPEPTKKGIGYKVFVLKDGKLYPPMVANPNGAETPVGVWLDADAAPIAGESKTGRPQVKQGGKGTQGGSGKLAYRPGWHLGVIPYALQFNRKDAEGNKTLFPANFVFAEVEYAADVDYQEEARQEGINANGKYQHSLAGLKHLPTDGYYMYRTNPNPETDPWVITGAMKVNRILTRTEQADLVKKAGREPQQIQEGDIVTDEVVNSINQQIANMPKFSLKVYHGSGADFSEFDFSHMSEGAGSQAFGWGGYVTSSKKIGKDYAMLKDNPYSNLKADAKKFLETYPTYESFLANHKRIGARPGFTEDEKKEFYQSMVNAANVSRNLYEVNIPDDNGKNYLDWDAPLTDEQKNTIVKALKRLKIDFADLEKHGFSLDGSFGDNVYEYLYNALKNTKKWNSENRNRSVSKFLSSLGYTGIKYKAGRNFGGAEEGDTNYVIFKPEDMQIAEHTKFSIKTWHGSQADFDKFDHSFMGSGEGAQAYGWGTYVSEVEGIAKAYAKANSAKHSNGEFARAEQAYKRAKRLYDDTVRRIADEELDLKMFYEPVFEKTKKLLDKAIRNNSTDLIKRFTERVKETENDLNESKEKLVNLRNHVDEYYKSMEVSKKKYDSIEKPERNLYTVEIPDDTGDNYLGWDKVYRNDKLYSMLGKIGKALESKGIDLDKEYNQSASWNTWIERLKEEGEDWTPNVATGEEIYNKLSSMLGVNAYQGNQKAASLVLKDASFDGVKVIAQRNTGGNKEGKMNYVIFDENNAKIVDHAKFSLRLKSAIDETETNPSDAQKESGNYKKGHVKFGGYDYTIENPRGSVRSGVDGDGKPWSIKMHDTYGYIRGKFGKDGDHLDMFINDDADLDNWDGDVYVVDQVNPDGSFDEHKVMYGYDSMDDAKKTYLANYSKGWQGLGNITGVSKDEFDKWLDTSKRKLKPFADYAKVKFSQAQGAPMFSLKDKDKARRIEKLRDSEPIEITGKEITPSDDLKQYKKNALEFGKSLRGTYRNEDTGEKIDLTGGNKRGGIREILQHDYKDIEHLQSIAAIPQIIRKSIFIDELPNEDKQHYPDVKSFRYYVCGLKIGGKDYTVKAVVAEQNNGNRYYDHRLTDIEKGKLLSIIPTIQKAGIDGNLPNSAYKDKRLISILQTNPQKNDNEAQKFSLKDEDKTMFGMHNISLDKLRKAIKQGGFAAPSMGVIDSKNGIYSDYGEITLIPKAEKLAKSKGKNAGTFTADGWTPIYPKVELRASKEGKSRIQNDTLVNDKIDEKLGKSLFNRWENYLEKNQGDPMDFAWQYMFEKGMNPEIVRNENPFSDEISNKVLDITKRGTKYQNELTDDEKGELIKLYNDYLESTGKGAVTKEGIKEIIKILKEDIENTKWTLVKKGLQKKIDFFEKYGGDVDDAVGWAYADVLAAAKKGNGVNSYKTFAAAKDKVFADRKMKHDFNKWFDGKLQEYGVEEMLYAGETPSGKSKYVPNTVDNAVKIMKKKGLAGGYGNWSGVGAFIAKLAPTANTLSAMKKAKDKLIPFGDQRHNEVKDQIQKSYNELANDLTETTNGYHSFDMGIDRMQMLAEAQPKDVKGYIKNTWGIEVSDDWVGRYDKLVDAIKNDYPVYYFETKFMRPYGLDEFEKAIVPKDTPKDVLDALKKAGIDVHTYEAGNKKDREKVTMDAVNNSDNIRFSLASETEDVAREGQIFLGVEDGSDRYSIRAYHGTGASFDAFDSSHALEGEGSETFGHGVYVTSSEKIGADYAKRAKERKSPTLNGFIVPDYASGKPNIKSVINMLGRKVNNHGEGFEDAKQSIINMLKDALDDLRREAKESTAVNRNFDEEIKEVKENINFLNKVAEDELKPEKTANRYDVEVPDDNGQNYLKWHGALPSSLNKEKLAKDMLGFIQEKEGEMEDWELESLENDINDSLEWANNGEQLYKAVGLYVGDVDASRILSDNGIVGMKYRAGMIHGGAKENDYNYVIYKDSDAKIVGNTKFSLRADQYQHDLAQWKKDNNLPKDAERPAIPVREPNESATDFVKRVKEYRKQMALWKTAPTYEQHLLTSNTAQGQFNLELQKGSVLARIALQDSMLPIRKAQEAIMKEVGIDRLNIAEDAYTAENRSHGKGKNEFEEYNDEFLQPLRKSYNKMMKNLGKSYDNVKVYMIAKHGLERNAHIAFKKSLEADYEKQEERINAYKAYKADMDRMANNIDFENGKINFTTWRQNDNAIRTKYAPSYLDYRYDKIGITQDYSGLSALFDGSDFEEAAAELVKDVETKFDGDTNELWYNTNAATKKILRDSWKAGMMSDEVYEFVRGMYDHYIPLRGWGDTNADQVWNYMGGGKGAFNQTLKKANGRGSLADDPIAYIENMAESGILINNKNWVKQHLLLLAENHPTSLLNLSKAWYIKTMDAQGNEEWIPASPNITANMTSQQVKNELENFQKRMEAMEKKGDATQKREHLEISYPQTNSEEREHEVRVMKNGEEYVIYVNGDPQLAQAMNNTRAHRVREGLQNSISQRALASLGRKMAAAYTSLSPLFIPSNYFRDFTMTLASTAIREDARYNYLLRKNMATHWNTFPLVLSYQNGTLREKVRDGEASKTEQMFYDFMMNGGETGFVSSLDVEDLKKKFKNDLKDMNRMAVNPKKIGHVIMDSIETLNRAIEDSNRFMVYMTSIQYGRSIDEAVNDAKDVTLNFNRKGTGEHGWQTFRNLYLFINPAIQSLQTLGALAKHHPFKFTAVTTAWLTSGVLVPMVNIAAMRIFGAIASWWSGDDDKDRYKDIEDKYWQFTKWDRRNNLILWVPGTHNFIKIPLAQEFRGFYGVGDMIASKLWGGEKAEESWEDYGLDLMGQVVDMLPLDPTGYDGNIAVSLMPNPIRPMFELAFNVDFTGKPLFKDSEYNKYDPNFTKAFAGTPDWLVRISKMVNSVGNDYPDVQQNAIDKFGDPRFNLNNPAVVDHVLSSYLGGAYTMGSQILGVATKALNGDEIKMADVPLVSKFVSNPDDRPVSKKQGDEFWTTKERHDRAANTLSKLKKKAKVDGDYSTLDVFFNSDEYKQYKLDDKVVKKYEEDKKKERAEESGDEYKSHKTTYADIYKAHATPKDDFEDLKMSQIYPKVNGIKKSWEGLLDMASSQADSFYNQNADAIQAAGEVADIREQINEIKKDFLSGDGKDAYNAEGMKKIRQLRKEALDILEKANKMIVARQKEKADNQ